MQLPLLSGEGRLPTPFSILGRIGGDATLPAAFLRLHKSNFQYPRSDRRRCNLLFRAPIPWNCSTFSILGRIGGDATSGWGIGGDGAFPLSVSSVGSEAMQPDPGGGGVCSPSRLSVSSVGSEAMQRWNGVQTAGANPDFQYPRSDRRRCNKAEEPPRRQPLSSFSILGRIGGDATLVGSFLFSGIFRRFQYPRSDRRRCNLCGMRGPWALHRLSVSSVGSEAMQPRCWYSKRQMTPPFSILGRIGGDATLSTPTTSSWPFLLSVSSVGSEAMQQCQRGLCTPDAWYFQYPRSDRRRCNVGCRCEGPGSCYLSVSSVGSEAMQPVCTTWMAKAWTAFSILGRIGGDATLTHTLLATVDSVPFSILGRIGGDATLNQKWEVCHGDSFSILGRIGGDATPPPEGEKISRIPLFQYPRSDRRRCNSAPDTAVARRGRLSVSSVGSEAMQRDQNDEAGDGWIHFQYPRSDRRRCNSATPGGGRTSRPLSVSSVGSEAMQLSCVQAAVDAVACTFSILGRIGGDATTPASSRSGSGSNFQYPRSDRRRCNCDDCRARGSLYCLSVSSVGSEAMQPAGRC